MQTSSVTSVLIVPLILPLTVLTTACDGADREGAGEVRGARDTSPLFSSQPSYRTGIEFANLLPENFERNGLTYQYYYNGGGVAVGDLDGDDLPDLYFTANMAPNRLYLNEGDLAFRDVTAQAGVEGVRGGWSTGVTLVDVNADGRLDIYVSQSGPFGDEDLRRNLLYINETEEPGQPRFSEEAASWGLDDPGYATQAAFFDADGDGDLDAYLMNVGIPAYRSILELQEGRSPYETDKFFRNEGDRFVDVSSQAGLIDTNLGFGLGVSVGDLNNDGIPDIYVANDYSGPDYLYLGDGRGRFREVMEAAFPHTPLSSMGSDLADMNGDGWLDLVVLEMALPTHLDRMNADDGLVKLRFDLLVREDLHFQYLYNGLQWNRGVPAGDPGMPAGDQGTPEGGVPFFSDIAGMNGFSRTDWSWAPVFADLNNDGHPDIFVSNGMAGRAIDPEYDEYVRRRDAEVREEFGGLTEALVMELIRAMPRRKAPNRAFRNEGNLTFTEVAGEWGLGRATYSNGVVYSDLDRDGDLDLVINNLLEEALVYRNNSREREDSHFLALQFQGPSANPFGIGARVRIKIGNVQQVQELQMTRGYQSSVEPRLHFGLGSATLVDSLEIRWPDGTVEIRTGIPADQTLVLNQADHFAPDAVPLPPEAMRPKPPATLFQGAQERLLPPPHHEAGVTMVDPSLQPYPSSRDEIAVAVGDLNGDGLDDFVWGGSGGEPTWIYTQGEGGDFRGTSSLPLAGSEEGVEAAAILDADGDGQKDVWLATAYGSGGGASVLRHRLFLNRGNGEFADPTIVLEETGSQGTTLAVGDLQGDGQPDLFVGHRSIPGMGPGPGSRILVGDGGVFRDVTAEAAPSLSNLRTVTDALWADLNGDGSQDLLVAGEWMPPRVFANQDRRLRETTAEAGLQDLKGWWQSLAATDADQDGDLDVIAGNMGLNHLLQPTIDQPVHLFVGDFDGDGEEDALPAYHEEGVLYPWFGRDQISETLPWVQDLYPTLDEYGRATFQEIVGEEGLAAAYRLDVQTLASLYLENQGDGSFRIRELPREAQVSPIMGILPADFDGDGNPDLLLSGNLYPFDPSVPRLDGGVGLYLKGNGVGGFAPVPPMESGLWLEGPARGTHLLRIQAAGRLGTLTGFVGGEARMYVVR